LWGMWKWRIEGMKDQKPNEFLDDIKAR